MICRTNSQRLRRKGTVAVMVAISLVPLIGVTAFAIDGGLLIAAKRRAQTVADAAAHASACQLYAKRTSDPSGLDSNGSARAAALSNASANDFNNDGSTNTVKVNIPPSNQSKLFQFKPGYSEVVIVYNQPRIFSAIFGSGNLSITAKAVARGIVSNTTSHSLILLDPGVSGAFTISNSTSLTTTGNIQVNSSNSSAAIDTNGASLTTPSLAIVGGFYVNNPGQINAGSVSTSAPGMKDPLSAIMAPDPSSMTSQPQSSITNTKGLTLQPGVFNNGLHLSSGSSVVLSPGIYYMKGGGFTVDGSSSVSGSGVTIYVDNSAGSTNSGFSVTNNSTVQLTPPPTGNYAGLVYFQDPNSSMSISNIGGTGSNVKGTIYAAGGSYNVNSGSSSTTFGSQLIVKNMDLSNGSNINIDSSVPGTTAGSRSLQVVE